MCTLRPSSLSSIVTESTRKDMSSVTTSTTVWPAGRPAVLGDGRGEDPDVGGALGPLGGQAVLAHRGAVHVDVGALGEVLDGHVAVVLAQEGSTVSRGGPPLPRRVEASAAALAMSSSWGSSCRDDP